MARDGVPPPSLAVDGPRRCSHSGHHGHNARTCTARPVKLFGVRIDEKPAIRKSSSMCNLAGMADGGAGGARDGGYGSEGDDKRPHNKRGEAWSEEEHKKFLLGLSKLRKGDWRGISRNFVMTRTPTQVASHAQKYFIRQTNLNRRKRRSSLFDMVIDDTGDQSLSRTSSQELSLSGTSSQELSLSRTSSLELSLSRSSSQDVEECLDDPRHVTAPVPVATIISPPPQVPAMQTQPEENVSFGSSLYAGEAGMKMPQVMPPYDYPVMLPPPYYPQSFVPAPYYCYAPMFYGPPGAAQASHEFYGSSSAVRASRELQLHGSAGTVQASPEYYGSSGTAQASHHVVKPVAVHSKPSLNMEDLYDMSGLSLKGDSSTNNIAPKSPPPRTNPIGRPERQSAFHGKGLPIAGRMG